MYVGKLSLCLFVRDPACKIAGGHTRPYQYTWERKYLILIPTAYHGYKIIPYPYSLCVAGTHQVGTYTHNIPVDMIILIIKVSTKYKMLMLHT
jgi:hypothetical protein